jgi:Glycosyltransferase family 87
LFMWQVPNYPLTGYILLAPYALMDWKYAKIAWALTNYMATFIIIYCLQNIWKIKYMSIIILTCSIYLISNPYRNVINNGQHDLFVLALFLSSVVSAKNNKILSGILLGLSWFKFTVTFPLSLFFIIKREWLPMAIGILVQCFLFTVICFWLNQSHAYIIDRYLKVLFKFGKFMDWFPYRQYNYVVFIIPIWYGIHFVESKFIKSQIKQHNNYGSFPH